ncbi:MAG: hypothetical protein M3N49_12410 [Candidatus Eremiobacteraeota bacterium]|nr:hypothetical protein [Candidatus Eremiobacteraeota bacterium]
MPVVLSQLFLPSDRVYQDAEFSLYHYPKVYFGRVQPFDRFIYYRPLGKSRRRSDSLHYFGYGRLGQWFPDPLRSDHRFVPIISGDRFRNLVPITEPDGTFYETEERRTPQFQSAVRTISETAYWRILTTGGVTQIELNALPDTETIAASPYPLPLVAAPTDPFRPISDIPPGAGYVPRGDTKLNIYEAAALQERAREDHQRVLHVIQREVARRGGMTFYNNNVDLFARLGEQRYLIEAKSLNRAADAVGRMRCGIGQLADYSYRYESELGGANRVLAFGTLPTAENTWIGHVMDRESVAFVCSLEDRVVALNEAAQSLPFVSSE